MLLLDLEHTVYSENWVCAYVTFWLKQQGFTNVRRI